MHATHIISCAFNYSIGRIILFDFFFLTTSLSSSRGRHLFNRLYILDNRTFGHWITSFILNYSCGITESLKSPIDCSLQQVREKNGTCSAILSTSDSQKKNKIAPILWNRAFILSVYFSGHPELKADCLSCFLLRCKLEEASKEMTALSTKIKEVLNSRKKKVYFYPKQCTAVHQHSDIFFISMPSKFN